MSLLNKLVVVTLPAVPKPIVRHFAGRYIAGETLADAVRCVRHLNGEGVCATLDVLGEDIADGGVVHLVGIQESPHHSDAALAASDEGHIDLVVRAQDARIGESRKGGRAAEEVSAQYLIFRHTGIIPAGRGA